MSKKKKEGRRIKSLHPMDMVSPYLMPTRIGAMNLFKDSFDMTEAEKYILAKRKEGLSNFGFVHLLLAAYVRGLASRPGVNRFIRGQRVYARNRITICMTIKKELSLNAQETVIKVHLAPDMTAEQVYNAFNNAVSEAKSEEENSFDAVAKLLHFIPGVLLKFFVWCLRVMDYFGILPKSLVEVSPFHGSLFLTSMGSLGIPPIYHHLYNFGNLPVFVAYGTKKVDYALDDEGNVKQRKHVDFTVSCDERICDGHYYASFFKTVKKYFKDPFKLDSPPDEIVEDIK